MQTVPASGNDLVSFYVGDFQLTYVPPPTIQTGIPSIFKTLSPLLPGRRGGGLDGSFRTARTAIDQALRQHHFGKRHEVEFGGSHLGHVYLQNADSEVGLAVCNKMRVRGQNLVWSTGEQTPAYATGDGTNSSANQATVTANIQEHIQNEVQHFGSGGVCLGRGERTDRSYPIRLLYHGPFYQVLGKGYIDVALQAARQYAPPGTKLFINDYSTTDPNRLACLVRVVRDLRERGIPMDGIGHEMHNDINYPSADAIVNAIDTMHENFRDIDQQMTEMDISVYNAGDNTSNYATTVPPSLIAEQGWLYKQYFDAFCGACAAR